MLNLNKRNVNRMNSTETTLSETDLIPLARSVGEALVAAGLLAATAESCWLSNSKNCMVLCERIKKEPDWPCEGCQPDPSSATLKRGSTGNNSDSLPKRQLLSTR